MSVLLLLECGDNNKECHRTKKEKNKKITIKKNDQNVVAELHIKKNNMNKWHKVTEKKCVTNKQNVKSFFTRDI